MRGLRELERDALVRLRATLQADTRRTCGRPGDSAGGRGRERGARRLLQEAPPAVLSRVARLRSLAAITQLIHGNLLLHEELARCPGPDEAPEPHCSRPETRAAILGTYMQRLQPPSRVGYRL